MDEVKKRNATSSFNKTLLNLVIVSNNPSVGYAKFAVDYWRIAYFLFYAVYGIRTKSSIVVLYCIVEQIMLDLAELEKVNQTANC